MGISQRPFGIVGFVILWIILFVLAAIFDLSISQSLVGSSETIGHITAEYGEVPGFLLILVSALILVSSTEGKRQLLYILVAMIPSVAISLALWEELLPQIISSVLIFFLVYQLVANVGIEDPRVVEAAQKTATFATLVPLVLILSIKSIWGRVRYRDLDPSFSNFTPWYFPQGYTGNFSFPSGHAGMAWVTICLMYYFTGRRRLIVQVVSGIWIVLVSYGRIVVGAHYLSDVLFSATLSLIVLYLLDRRIKYQSLFSI